MENNDIRWEQRFSNFKKALSKLGEVAAIKTIDDLSELEKEGLIQRFEYTYELAWKTLQALTPSWCNHFRMAIYKTVNPGKK